MLDKQKEVRLSKMLSLMLRHEPEKFGLTLDERGFTPLADVLAAVRRKAQWSGIGEAEIRFVVRNSDKQRYEIEGDFIRARYGHSVEGKVQHEPVEPPEILYHGTSPRAAEAIAREGISSMNRQYVHLSSEVAQARAVGLRHAAKPVILTIRARDAHAAGVQFYQPEPRLFLADEVPAEFIETTDERE